MNWCYDFGILVFQLAFQYSVCASRRMAGRRGASFFKLTKPASHASRSRSLSFTHCGLSLKSLRRRGRQRGKQNAGKCGGMGFRTLSLPQNELTHSISHTIRVFQHSNRPECHPPHRGVSTLEDGMAQFRDHHFLYMYMYMSHGSLGLLRAGWCSV